MIEHVASISTNNGILIAIVRASLPSRKKWQATLAIMRRRRPVAVKNLASDARSASFPMPMKWDRQEYCGSSIS